MIHPLDVILHKRDGLVLSPEEIHAFIHAVVNRQPPVTDAQIASFLMAVFQRGLNPEELAALTEAMRFSGETFNAAPLHTSSPVFLVDKHSTGGVGDKTSLLIAPILAAAGLLNPTPAGVPGICVPMISGRSLGHTGGTLDKLETIPGFDTQLSMPRFEEVLRQCGAALIGQTPTLVPADRILYALRDHTGTVDSPFLITASIMSKKLAESLDALVLDVKTGSGAFMKREEDARNLARLMVQTGEAAGTRTVALLTRMDQPLGRFAGNWLEVLECVDILQGHRHPLSADLIELTLALSAHMLLLAGSEPSLESAHLRANQLLANGSAYRAWLCIVEAQGGDTTIFNTPDSEPQSVPHCSRSHPGSPPSELARWGDQRDEWAHPDALHTFHKPTATTQVLAQSSGYLHSIDCTEAGWAVQRLGAGRAKPGDPVSAHAGLEVHAKLGDRIEEGQPLLTLYAEDQSLLAEPAAMLQATYQITDTRPTLPPLIQEVIRK